MAEVYNHEQSKASSCMCLPRIFTTAEERRQTALAKYQEEYRKSMSGHYQVSSSSTLQADNWQAYPLYRAESGPLTLARANSAMDTIVEESSIKTHTSYGGSQHDKSISSYYPSSQQK